jgi:hypothetical protein
MAGVSFEIRLMETGSVDGTIAASDMARICESLQELATRVGRWVCDARDLRRLPKGSKEITRVRFTGLAAGSTCLVFSTEAAQPELEGTFPPTEEVDNRYWDIVYGCGLARFPPDAPGPVRDSALKVIRSMSAAAKRVAVKGVSEGLVGQEAHFQPAVIESLPWFHERSVTPSPQLLVVQGTLEMVDLRSARFRLRDSLGNGIDLLKVPNAGNAAARLVGRVVVAQGEGTTNSITAPALRLADPSPWDTDRIVDPAMQPISPVGSPYDPNAPVFELTDVEWSSFWEAING